jgi:acyl-coenzyme A synthetase/AMP-(fatty) acid ligase
LRTGDAARRDAEGFIWIVDRVADAYRSAGHIVYPGDVERAIADHPAVADVAAVARDEGADAFVVLAPDCHPTERELLEHSRRRLPVHAVPRAVVFVDALPRSSVGKLLRHELAGVIIPDA